jgi:hypothetical protein
VPVGGWKLPLGVGSEMPAADRHSWIFWKSAPKPGPPPGLLPAVDVGAAVVVPSVAAAGGQQKGAGQRQRTARERARIMT